MNGAQHHKEAERLLSDDSAEALQRAMVHALLAVAAQLETSPSLAVRSTTGSDPRKRPITRMPDRPL
jgi:hypothetical protein